MWPKQLLCKTTLTLTFWEIVQGKSSTQRWQSLTIQACRTAGLYRSPNTEINTCTFVSGRLGLHIHIATWQLSGKHGSSSTSSAMPCLNKGKKFNWQRKHIRNFLYTLWRGTLRTEGLSRLQVQKSSNQWSKVGHGSYQFKEIYMYVINEVDL